MNQYFPKPYEPFDGDVNIKVDFSNYATKAEDIKNISHVDTCFALKLNLASLQTEIGKLDVEKISAFSC